MFGSAPARASPSEIAWRAMIPIEEVPTQIGPGQSVHIDRDEYVGWIGPNGHADLLPDPGRQAPTTSSSAMSEDWVEESWTAPSTVQEILAAHEGWNEALLGMLSKVENVYK